MQPELHCITDDNSFGVFGKDLITLAVVEGGANVESSLVQKSHDWQSAGLVWICTRHPVGPIGMALKLKGPKRASQAEAAVPTFGWQRRLRVSLACRRSKSICLLERRVLCQQGWQESDP